MSRLGWSREVDLEEVPERPGVYLFRDAEDKVLYVGKAASLRDRLRSYRAGGDGRSNVLFLLDFATTVETIVTRTEQEALLLEDSLIKAHQPAHNIRLKDDKSFRMLRLDLDESFPRLKHVRAHSPNAGREGGRARFFGPFVSSSALRRALSDLHRVVPLRDCPDSVMEHRSRPCLKHQMGLCSAPCVGLVTAEDYRVLVDKASSVLTGDIAAVESELDGRMRAASEALDFERAGVWRDRLFALRRTVESQGVRPKDEVSRDVLAYARRAGEVIVHRLAFRGGRLAESRTHAFRSILEDAELVHNVLTALYASGAREVPDEIVLPCLPTEHVLLSQTLRGSPRLVVPREGEKRRMLELAGENARAELARTGNEKAREDEALERLADLLDLDGPPEIIDGFDISNLQGTNVVASRVRFRAGHADRAGYRRFKVRGVEGQDDFASMKEVVGRSLRRGVLEDDLPSLILIDGGAAQLAKALEAREEAGAFSVALLGLAKARSERKVGGRTKSASEERVYLPGALEPIELARHDPARLLLERIRDEAHRFAVTYHRKERGKIRSRLDSVPGLGPAKRKALLRAFGSVKVIESASIEAISAVAGIGPDLARRLLDLLRAQ